ncbi:SCO family protein [Solemya velesiana gill symbiont]|uniref:Cytochrome oxidase assembly protein n=1 Tax=Solemya velesiana gill symbiont TaxID=1918948 RepID=A0A1T2KV38_9GAMM|nr:SCO family protein [Solemya velesiana gill symbiont]OOZ36682.1 cytochrome oxidase assembly protein [Solemya velesiana gill symbiont]
MFRKAVFLLVGCLFLLPVLAEEQVQQKDAVPDISDAPPGGDFTLRSSRGPFNLKDLRSKVVLLYFGYTKCPDVCPTSLAFTAQVLNELDDEELKKVRAVFVSVDPKRDTVETLDEYVGYFHPNFIGVTGSDEEVAVAAKLYGAKYNEVALKDSAFGYSVSHSAVTYLITPEGELRFIFPHATHPAIILEAVRYVLTGN